MPVDFYLLFSYLLVYCWLASLMMLLYFGKIPTRVANQHQEKATSWPFFAYKVLHVEHIECMFQKREFKASFIKEKWGAFVEIDLSFKFLWSTFFLKQSKTSNGLCASQPLVAKVPSSTLSQSNIFPIFSLFQYFFM